MLLLDLNKNAPGITDTTRQENITEAHSTLSKLNVPSLCNRNKCLYYLAESELHTQRQNVRSAIKAARDAQTLATKCDFTCLLYLVNAKLHCLQLLHF